jgi:hypothetical protein
VKWDFIWDTTEFHPTDRQFGMEETRAVDERAVVG